MAKDIQVVLDCTDPVALGLWWAQTLDWEYEWLDRALFEQLRDGGYCTDSDVSEIDGKLTWRDGAAINSGGGRAAQHRIYLQAVPEAKTVKNRMHIDVRSGDEDRDDVVRRLVERGASQLGQGQQGPHSWVVMADPEGNEFCVS